MLSEQVMVEKVLTFFGDVVQGPVVRNGLPKLKAFNFVMDEALEGSVNDALAVDTHGKSLASIVLRMEIDVPDDHWSVQDSAGVPGERRPR